MDEHAIGLIHPGEMGAEVGACLLRAGARVLWAKGGRSAATATRARDTGLEETPDLAGLVAACGRIVSVCPPSAALSVARQVGDLGFQGVYLDANAIAPATARAIRAVFASGAAVSVVDGGIVGPPPRGPGLSRLYLSGERAAEVADWFEGGHLEAVVMDGPVGAASALKMAYAGWTKGTTALLAAVWATARAEGVAADLGAEWARSIPGLAARVDSLPGVSSKAWRFEGEMLEIAETFEAAGLPGGFHRAAAELYARLADLRDAPAPPDAAALVDRLRAPRSRRGPTDAA